jgi:hypothetical protein
MTEMASPKGGSRHRRGGTCRPDKQFAPQERRSLTRDRRYQIATDIRAKAPSTSFDAEGRLVLHNFVVDGTPAEVARQAVEREADLGVVVRQMIAIGAVVLEHGTSKSTVETVTAEIDRLAEVVANAATHGLPEALREHLTRFEESLGAQFDPKRVDAIPNQLTSVFEKFANKHKNELIAAFLDENGPLAVVKSELAAKLQFVAARQDDLVKQMTAVAERVAASSAIERERDRGTAKGVDFEDVVGAVLDWSFAPYEDIVEDVGTTPGAAGNKNGDHVVYLNPATTGGRDLRIVVESKFRRLGIQAALAELDRAIDNREAEAGIMVFARANDAPLQGRSLRIFPGNRIVVVFDNADPDRLPLEVACHFARAVVLAEQDDGEEAVACEVIAEQVGRLTEIIEEARAIRRGVNAARKGIDHVDDAYEKLRSEALASIVLIRASVS